jgi:large subunit ribosomal protein L17
MRHRVATKKLGRTASHRDSLLSNLVRSLILNYSIITTLSKAKEGARLAAKVITLAKREDLNSRREILRYIRDKRAVKKLWEEIAPSYKDRNGGYTRIIRMGKRKGDSSPLALLELIGFERIKPVKKEKREGR